jgi:hypothetical protein
LKGGSAEKPPGPRHFYCDCTPAFLMMGTHLSISDLR